MRYFLSFLILIAVVTLMFRIFSMVLDNLPYDLGDHLLFLVGVVLLVVLLIYYKNPDFWKLYVNENTMFEGGGLFD